MVYLAGWLHIKMQFFKTLNCLLLIAFSFVSHAEQSINLELQVLKQQSLLLDRDLLIVEDKIKKPFSIYLSQLTDAKFAIETLNIQLDGKQLVRHQYTDIERQALKKGGAQLLFKGSLDEGEHQIIAYYRSNKDYQSGEQFTFNKNSAALAIEISLYKGESKESRLQPKVDIKKVQSAQGSTEPVIYRYLKYLKQSAPNIDILSQVMKAQKLEALGDYEIQTALIKGQLYLEKGLHIEAGKIFKKIIKSKKTPAKLQNEARFYLGKSYYLSGENKKSLDLFNKVKYPVSKSVRAELQHLTSLLLMSQGEYKQAAQYLREHWWKAPENWDLYARLNLGVALIHSGDEDAGIRLIKKIGEKQLRSTEEKSLVDKANQSLGYFYLKQNNPQLARKYLEKVSLNGPYSNLALLGAGWASARLQQYNQAVIPWMELQKNDMRDITVQEAMLTVPYAFEQMGLIKKSVRYYQKSVRYYQKSVKAYEKERHELTASLAALRQNELRNELKKLNILSESAWLQSINKVSEQKSSRYIKQLIEDGMFFNLLLNFREARLLKINADAKIEKISDIQNRLLQQAGIHVQDKEKNNRDQISFINILTADLLKRSYQMKLKTQENINLIISQMKDRALIILTLRKSKLDVYLVQSRLALAQSYDRLNP